MSYMTKPITEHDLVEVQDWSLCEMRSHFRRLAILVICVSFCVQRSYLFTLCGNTSYNQQIGDKFYYSVICNLLCITKCTKRYMI